LVILRSCDRIAASKKIVFYADHSPVQGLAKLTDVSIFRRVPLEHFDHAAGLPCPPIRQIARTVR
jgi:hypothetical protein